MTAYDLIGRLPDDQQLVAGIVYEALRKSAPSEQYEIGRAEIAVEVLAGFGVAAAERLVARWSCEGVPA